MKRAAIVAAIVLGVGAGVAAPAYAEPGQICLVLSEDRRGICVEIGQEIQPPR